jgi:hypothetical protein
VYKFKILTDFISFFRESIVKFFITMPKITQTELSFLMLSDVTDVTEAPNLCKGLRISGKHPLTFKKILKQKIPRRHSITLTKSFALTLQRP